MTPLLNKKAIRQIQNPIFAEYARQYLKIYDSFTRQVEQFGLPFSHDRRVEAEITALRRELKASGILERNNGASLRTAYLSSACVACREGIGSYTGILSLMCHRNCYYCFNPNQENYEIFRTRQKDWRQELAAVYAQDKNLKQIALTGGEPLIHPSETVEFFTLARQYWPEVHARLYTSGDLLEKKTLALLRDAGLREIRFSLKLEDSPALRETVYDKIALARQKIPLVLVEMPVLPDAETKMKQVLDRLETLGIFGINLLELCFPYRNAREFQRRGYLLRYPPYQTLYNFWYAGGLPVSGSERTALKLLLYAIERKYRLNVHYCSLENKHFGQIYQQNSGAAVDNTYLFSQKDFYLKTIKAFGDDVLPLQKQLEKQSAGQYRVDESHRFIQFSPLLLKNLGEITAELAVSYNVAEYREAEQVIRELRLDYAKAGELSLENI